MAVDDSVTPLLLGTSSNPTLLSKAARKWLRRSRTAPSPRAPRPCFIDDDNNNNNNNQTSFGDNPRPLFVLIILTSYLGLGTICFYFIKDDLTGKKTNGIIDALYFSIVTMTTVGYGDLVPGTTLSKLCACLFVFVGMAIVGMVLSKVADYFVEKQELMMSKALHISDNNSGSSASLDDILREVGTHKIKYKFIACLTLIVTLMGLGMVVLIQVEGKTLVNAFYCVCATITTLGFGDLSFSTEGGRAFAVVWILSSTLCLAQLFFYLTEMLAQKRQRLLLQSVLDRKLTFEDIEAADLNHDNVVSAAEFILFKLKEMGKVNDNDIGPLMECFKKLDIDRTQTLTTADIIHAQSAARPANG